MTQKTALLTALTITTLGMVVPSHVYAATTPSFPSCVNPQGNLKASYDSGVHGVVGMTDSKTGSDKVYQLSGNEQLMQCYCPENGNGIQTNWWKVSHLSESEINSLKKEGWIYVADGSAWGLDGAQYVAKNSDYNCKGTSVTPTPNPVKEVLSLASTGNNAFLYVLMSLGSIAIISGLLLGLKKN